MVYFLNQYIMITTFKVSKFNLIHKRILNVYVGISYDIIIYKNKYN